MLKEKTNHRLLVSGAVLLVFGLAAGALWDLEIDRFLYQPTSLPAILMEAYGWLPQYLPPVLLLACFALDDSRKKPLRIISGVLCTLGGAGLAYIGNFHMLRRGISAVQSALWTALFAGLVLLLSVSAFRACRGADRKKLEFILFWGTMYLVIGLAVINLFKSIWQRTRFDDMIAAAGGTMENAFGLFTGWLHPFGNGGSSFPSGHTAAACSVFVLCFACDLFRGWNRRRTLIWCLCWGYVVWMALCRLVIGRHYLSDTVAAAAIMFALYLLVTKSRKYRTGAKQLCG